MAMMAGVSAKKGSPTEGRKARALPGYTGLLMSAVGRSEQQGPSG